MFHACMFQIATLEPMITGLQEALPKSIGLLPFDGGVTGTRLLQIFIEVFFFFFCFVIHIITKNNLSFT
jgi:hypothetical protein